MTRCEDDCELRERLDALERQQFKVKRTLKSTMETVNTGTYLDKRIIAAINRLIRDTRELQQKEVDSIKKDQAIERSRRRKDRFITGAFFLVLALGYLKGELESGKIIDVLIQSGLFSALGVYSATSKD